MTEVKKTESTQPKDVPSPVLMMLCPNCSDHNFTYIAPAVYGNVGIQQIQCGTCGIIVMR